MIKKIKEAMLDCCNYTGSDPVEYVEQYIREDIEPELEQLQREAIYYAWDAHKHLRNPELEVSNEEIFQDYLEQSKEGKKDE